jgi:tRNA threonylcarbamoyladenosine biosynthesis protein TsaE
MSTIHLPDDDATGALGALIAAVLRPGDVVTLSGGLGAGKSALARAVIRTLAGDPALDVPSPSFALVQPYDTPAGPVVHADLYRLTDAHEADELGLFDRPEAIVLIEWPERAPEIGSMATAAIALSIPVGGGRDAALSFADGRSF